MRRQRVVHASKPDLETYGGVIVKISAGISEDMLSSNEKAQATIIRLATKLQKEYNLPDSATRYAIVRKAIDLYRLHSKNE